MISGSRNAVKATGIIFKKLSLATLIVVCAYLYTCTLSAQEPAEEQTTFASDETQAEVTSQQDNSLTIKREFINDPSLPGRGDFVVGPGKTELTVPAGEYRIVELLLTNRAGGDRVFNIVTEDAAGTRDPSVPVRLLGAERGPYTLKDYLEFPEKQIRLSNNERARVPVTVRIPADAEPGGLYGSVIITTTEPGDTEGSATGAAPRSAVVSRIGSLFFVTVPGEVETSGVFQSFETVPPQKFFTKGPIQFQILYENTGSIHLNPYGEMRITNMFGEEVGFVELDPWFALPQSLRSREVEWNREFLIGRYTATVNLNLGYDDIVESKELVFWVIPWQPIALVFVGLFLIFLLLQFIFKNFEFKRKV